MSNFPGEPRDRPLLFQPALAHSESQSWVLNGETIPLHHLMGNPQGACCQIVPSESPFFELCQDLLCILSLDGSFQRLNSAWKRVLGYETAGLLTTSFIDLAHPDDRATTLQHLQQLVNNYNHPVHFEIRYRCHDQSYRWLSWQAMALPDRALIYTVARDMTPQREAEAALQQAYQERNSIFESIMDAFLCLDQKWQVTYLNPRAEQILLCKREESLGKSFWDCFPESVGSLLEQECRRSVDQQTTVHFEYFYQILGIWLEVKASFSAHGLSVYFRDVTLRRQAETALSERTRLSGLGAEISAVLGQSGRLPEVLDRCVQAMVNHLGIASARIWTLDRDTGFLELQAIAGQHSHAESFQHRIPVGISIIGYIAQSRQPYLTNSASTDVCMGAWEWIQKENLIAFAGYPLVVEDRLVGVMALMSRQPLSDLIQTMLGSAATSIAIAIDRSWARAELQSRREALLFRLANQIRNSLDLDTILDTAVQEIRSLFQIDRCHFIWGYNEPDHLNLEVTHESRNPELPSLLGACSPEQLAVLSEKILQFTPVRINDVGNDPAIEPPLHHLLTEMGITSQLFIPLETRAGQMGAVVCSHCNGARPWSDSEVELLQTVINQLALAIDQAELYAQSRATAFAAQTQAKQLSDTLEDLRKTQSQLIQSEKMSSLGQMVAGIAHEINNPVSFITGNLSHASSYIQNLLEMLHLYQTYYPNPHPAIEEHAEEIDLDFLATDLPKLLASMRIGADRIRQIVLSLRNFSRLDEAEKKPVNIHEGIDSTLLILQNRLKPNGTSGGIQVIKEYGKFPRVNCYAGQLNQVFMNILSNAIDVLENQTGPKLITISTETAPASSPTGYPLAIIRIRDNGAGMPESVRQRLFDPFFTTKPVGKGTGLGLSISYQIVVDKHGGSLECFSQPGQGAEFVIQIPMPPVQD